MTGFFRFPHTPHLAWLGEGAPRDDKVLPPDEAAALLVGEVVIEEKIDGANLGFSVGQSGNLHIQNRGSHVDLGRSHPQFRQLRSWLQVRETTFVDALRPDLVLFGEWCYAVHSVAYNRLPDWFLGFDVYDRSADRFWNTTRRDELLAALNLHPVPRIACGRFSIEGVGALLSNKSRVGDEFVEGVVVRSQAEGFTTARAKLVRAEFSQTIDEHWSRKPLRRNELARGATPWL